MEPALTGTGSLLMEYVKLIFVLGGVLITAWLALRFWLPGMAMKVNRPDGPLEILAHQSLEPRKSLFMVRAGSSLLLLGSSEAGLTILERLDPEDERLRLAPQPPRAAFSELLRFRAKG